jgi:hypothetical protein
VNTGIEKILLEREDGQRVLSALSRFLREDGELLQIDANERSITHRLAEYLQWEFPLLHVDCEYNRDGIEPKRLPYLGLHPDADDEQAQTVFPDIIVHRRNSPENILVIEVKKSSNRNSRDIDLAKLRGYRANLKYRSALFLEFRVGANPGVQNVQWVDA